jgi:vacuolar iron transporter family protein
MLKKNIPVREVIFGLEDGAVSTLGILVGVAAGTNNRFFVILSGLVVIFVESLSMAAGTYLSNKSELEIQAARSRPSLLRKILFHNSPKKPSTSPIKESGYMGLSYIIGGFVSLVSFFFLPPSLAVISAVLLSLTFLFLVGFLKGRISQTSSFKSGLEMMTVSALASFVGFVIGKLAASILNTFPF